MAQAEEEIMGPLGDVEVLPPQEMLAQLHGINVAGEH